MPCVISHSNDCLLLPLCWLCHNSLLGMCAVWVGAPPHGWKWCLLMPFWMAGKAASLLASKGASMIVVANHLPCACPLPCSTHPAGVVWPPALGLGAHNDWLLGHHAKDTFLHQWYAMWGLPWILLAKLGRAVLVLHCLDGLMIQPAVVAWCLNKTGLQACYLVIKDSIMNDINMLLFLLRIKGMWSWMNANYQVFKTW